MVGVRGRGIDPEATGVGIGPGGGALRRLSSHPAAGPAVLAGSWIVPAACSVVALLFADAYHPNADIALIELHVRDVGSEKVLLGPYSRFGWSHPGPSMYYLLAVPYRLLGSTSANLLIGALLLNTAALVGVTIVAWRRGGAVLGALTFLLLGLTVRALGPQFLRDPWNPHLPVLPLALLLLTAWSLALGKRWALPVAAALASFVTQSHTGYAPVTAVVLAVALVGFVRSRPVRPLPAAALAAGIVGLLWLPPVLEEVVHRPGNLRSLLDFYTGDHAATGLGRGVRAVALQLGATPEWLVGRRPVQPFDGAVQLRSRIVPVAVVPVILAAVVGWRRGWRDIRWLSGLVVALILAAVASMSRVTGALLPYLTVWTWIVGVMAWLLAGAALTRWVCDVRPALGRPICRSLVVAGGAVLVVNSVSAASAGTPTGYESRIVGELGAGLATALAQDPDVVHLDVAGSFASGQYSPGVALQLERRGWRVEVDGGDELGFGRHRNRCTEGATSLLVAVDDEARIAARDDDLELLARAGTLPARERERRATLHDEVLAAGRAGSLSDEELYERVATLPDLGFQVAVFRDGTRRCDGAAR